MTADWPGMWKDGPIVDDGFAERCAHRLLRRRRTSAFPRDNDWRLYFYQRPRGLTQSELGYTIGLRELSRYELIIGLRSGPTEGPKPWVLPWRVWQFRTTTAARVGAAVQRCFDWLVEAIPRAAGVVILTDITDALSDGARAVLCDQGAERGLNPHVDYHNMTLREMREWFELAQPYFEQLDPERATRMAP